MDEHPSPAIRLNNIQALRGLAAMLVVLAHLALIEVKHGGDKLLPGFLRFGVSGVDLFFAISGFIMVYVTWSSQRNARQSMKFLFARITRIYPIYWLISAALFVVWLFKPSVMSYELTPMKLIKSVLLWPDIGLPMLQVAWTLIHEMYFYLIFALILLLPKRFLMPALGLWALILISGNLSGLGNSGPEMALIFNPLTAEFFLGAIAGWCFMKFEKNFAEACLILGAASFLGSYIYLAITLDAGIYPSNWARVFYFGLPAAFMIYGLSAIERLGVVVPKWSSTFGDWSYSLYLTHILSLSLIGYIWQPFARSGYLDNIIALCILLIATIIVAALSWYMFERPMLLLFKTIRQKLFP